jgi:hypothetical protein
LLAFDRLPEESLLPSLQEEAVELTGALIYGHG